MPVIQASDVAKMLLDTRADVRLEERNRLERIVREVQQSNCRRTKWSACEEIVRKLHDLVRG